MTEEQIINGMYVTSVATSALPFAMILFKGKKLKSKMYGWLGLYLFISLLIHLILLGLNRGVKINWFYYNISVFTSYIFITLFYYHLLKTRSLKHIILSKISIVVTVFIMEFLYHGMFNMYFEFTYLTIHFFVCANALYYYYEVLNNNIDQDFLENSGAFWINAAVLLFYGGAFIVAVIYSVIFKNILNHEVYSSLIIAILSIVANLLFSLGLTTRKIRLT